MKKRKYFNMVIVICIPLILLIRYMFLDPSLTDAINASFTGILVFVTFLYLIATQEILKEQENTRKIYSIDKLLENVYSPINNALTEFYQQLGGIDSLPSDYTPDNIREKFKDLHEKQLEINRKYGHLFNDDIRVAYQKLDFATCG